MKPLTKEQRIKRIKAEIARRKLARETVLDRINRNGFKEGTKEWWAIIKKAHRMQKRINVLTLTLKGLEQ